MVILAGQPAVNFLGQFYGPQDMIHPEARGGLAGRGAHCKEILPMARHRTVASAVLIALGANLPGPDGRSPRETCEAALRELAAAGIRIVRRSSWYRTEPVGEPDRKSVV